MWPYTPIRQPHLEHVTVCDTFTSRTWQLDLETGGVTPRSNPARPTNIAYWIVAVFGVFRVEGLQFEVFWKRVERRSWTGVRTGVLYFLT